MKPEALMNTATTFFFICYIPDFYANYVNKNANWYNVLEKVVLIIGTGFALGYAVNTDNHALIINYAPLFGLDIITLSMRTYYAYKNRNRDVRIVDQIENHIDNPLHTIDSESSLETF